MSVIGSQRTVFGDETGADGRVITDTDLNAISKNMTRRAWEAPGYAYLTGHDEIDESSGMRSYSQAFDGDAAVMGSRKYGVFTIGRGLQVSSSGLSTSVGSGFLGIWRDPTGPAPPPSSGDNRMNWVSVSNGDIAATHTAASPGKQRWDLVCVTPSEVNSSIVTRHFKDAVTGMISSQSVVPGRLPAITVSVVSGVEDNPGSADMPTLVDLDGEHVVCGVLVSDSAVVSVYDFTVPIGTVKDAVTLGSEGVPYGSEIVSAPWVIAQNQPSIKSVIGANGDLLLFPPAHVRGGSSNLLLGVKITHKLYAGSTVKLAVYPTDASSSIANLVDLTARITMDGAKRSKVLDLRAIPTYEDMAPFWMNGTYKKGSVDSMLCLRISADGASVSYLYEVRWFYL